MELHGKNIIGFTESAEGSNTLSSYNPNLGIDIDPAFTEATSNEVDRAMQLAADAFPAFRRISAPKRAHFLDVAADEIDALGDAITERAHSETGLPEARLNGERGRTVNQIRMFANLIREGSWVDARIDHAVPDRAPAPKPDTRLMLQPTGPVVVFGASNFPLAFSVAGGDTASALAAGCPVVVKAHRSHMGTSELVGRAVQKAAKATGMPDGVFSLLQGRGSSVGSALVQHPTATAVGFTGSHKGGRELFNQATARPTPIPVYAEMGSLNPVFVLPGALEHDGEAIARGLHGSVTLGVGQLCTHPCLVFGIEGDFFNALRNVLGDLFTETAPATMLNAGIRDTYAKGTQTVAAVAGVDLVARSSADPDPEKTQGAAHIFSTGVATFLNSPDLSEEVFGPSSVLVNCGSKADMEAAARKLDGHLTATLHGTDEDMAEHADLIAILEQKVGRLIFNGFPTGVEVCASMHHGGPYPATTDGRSTSVGTAAIFRFTRLVCYQDFPQGSLPDELKDANPRGILRIVNGSHTRDAS